MQYHRLVSDIYHEVPIEEFGSSKGILKILTLAPATFEAKRLYWISKVPEGERRGMHAHKNLRQIFVCLAGSFKITFDDGSVATTVQMTSNSEAIMIEPGLWRELFDFSSNALALIICDEPYRESDYIRDYEVFLHWKRER